MFCNLKTMLSLQYELVTVSLLAFAMLLVLRL